jgi:hypothetical protein
LNSGRKAQIGKGSREFTRMNTNLFWLRVETILIRVQENSYWASELYDQALFSSHTHKLVHRLAVEEIFSGIQ